MIRTKWRRLSGGLLAGALALSLSACGRQDKPITLDPIGRDVCEKTSFFQMAETEKGYYLNFQGELSYADKSDLTNWVQVCNEPDCLHRGDECPANISPTGFWLRDGRIYSIRDPSCIDRNSTTVGAICSTALDGTDLRLEYPLEMLEGGGLNCYATPEPDRMYLSVCKLETDGTWTYRLGRLDENGMDILLEESLTDEVQGFMPQADMCGDPAFYSSFLSGDGAELQKHLYRETENGMEEIPNICQYEVIGASLHGDTLLHFVPNDGYYRTDLTSGASEKLMDAQLTDSRGYIVENLLLETNLLWDHEPEKPEVRIYDGSSWHSVKLPEDMPIGGLNIHALTSEDLFLDMWHNYERMDLYRISLTGSTFELQFCDSFS